MDFRFAKKLYDGSQRTFTICGMADSLAPEIVQGKGHGFAADWCNAAFVSLLLHVTLFIMTHLQWFQSLKFIGLNPAGGLWEP